MTQGERVREIRKVLNMTMEQFGEKIGVTKATISNIENGNRNATEHMTKSICREFGVSYKWLTDGIGEMFIDSDDEFIGRIDQIMQNENDMRRELFKALLYATDEQLRSIESWIDFCADLKSENKKKS